MRRDYGLDRPLPVQYALWLSHVVRGDFGRSIANGRPVLSELWLAMQNTLVLSLVAATIGFVLGIVFGILAGAFLGSWLDRGIVSFAVFSSTPSLPSGLARSRASRSLSIGSTFATSFCRP